MVLWLVLDTLAADYFSLLMKEYHISPIDAHHMFIHSVNRYILWTSIGALVLGALLSFFFTQMVLWPLHQMTDTARLISAGDYSSRVRADSRDETGELAEAFNQMAENLERIEKLRKDMVSNVAHELRTPLTNIKGYLEALQDGVVPPTRETFELLEFVIENSGPGIESGDLPLIFERFYRGEKSRSRDYGGTGIGLIIVKDLVEAHGGRLGVESTPAKTLFWFTLPVG